MDETSESYVNINQKKKKKKSSDLLKFRDKSGIKIKSSHLISSSSRCIITDTPRIPQIIGNPLHDVARKRKEGRKEGSFD